MTRPVYLHRPAMVCALGNTTDAIASALLAVDQKPLTVTEEFTPGTALPVGKVTGDGEDQVISQQDESRNNQLLMRAVMQLAEPLSELRKTVPEGRIGVVLGTSTSGIAEAERGFEGLQAQGKLPPDFHYQQQEIGAPAQFLARHLGLSGPATTISTACSSSAKALASARRLLLSGLCDAVICGGIDTLCRLTVNGFSALDSVSSRTCNPLSRNRDGINIGEAACLFIMTADSGPVLLSGAGESSDAHHISAPHPEGRGAQAAIELALADAGLTPRDIGYVNLHGTATPQNDSTESRVVADIFGDGPYCSSTKPLTGHTLGAAGALEAAFCWLVLMGDGRLPPHWWDGDVDESVATLKLVSPGTRLEVAPRHTLSNSFAFGGNNIALVLSAAPSGQG